MTKLLIVYHSQSGNTEALARAIYHGISYRPDLSIRFLQAPATTLDDFIWCDLVIFGAAEYLGTLSGIMKDLFDRTFHDAKSKHIHRPYGVFISAGNNGTRAAAEIDRIVAHYPFYRLLAPWIVNGRINKNKLDDTESYGCDLLSAYEQNTMDYANA